MQKRGIVCNGPVGVGGASRPVPPPPPSCAKKLKKEKSTTLPSKILS